MNDNIRYTKIECPDCGVINVHCDLSFGWLGCASCGLAFQPSKAPFVEMRIDPRPVKGRRRSQAAVMAFTA